MWRHVVWLIGPDFPEEMPFSWLPHTFPSKSWLKHSHRLTKTALTLTVAAYEEVKTLDNVTGNGYIRVTNTLGWIFIVSCVCGLIPLFVMFNLVIGAHKYEFWLVTNRTLHFHFPVYLQGVEWDKFSLSVYLEGATAVIEVNRLVVPRIMSGDRTP